MFYILLVSLVLSCDAQELHESNGIDLLPANNICGIQNNDRIVGGVLTDLDEHPWTALIKYDRPKGNAFSCGGVLISSRYVMTAAHCVQNLPQDWKLSQVRLGEWNLTSKTDCQLDDCSSDPLDVDIEEAIAHENYNSTKGQNNDIALLRLVRDVRFSDFVKPICLPIGPALKKKTFEGYDMVVAGWGKTETRPLSTRFHLTTQLLNLVDSQTLYFFLTTFRECTMRKPIDSFTIAPAAKGTVTVRIYKE